MSGILETGEITTIDYRPSKTIIAFHRSNTPIRSIVGPVGSGKSTAATWEVCYYLPLLMREKYGVHKSRWLILRNTYAELIDTTQKTIFYWFPPKAFGKYYKQEKRYVLDYNGMEVELLFRSCDRPEDVKKFKSLEITGYWIDESCEVSHEIKLMLKNRIGRYPRAEEWPENKAMRWGIETTNPPEIESHDYQDFYGPNKLENHEGFWQEPGENKENLREGYYDDLRKEYAHDPEWVERYIDGKPGVMKVGKDVYNSFLREYHVSKSPLVWPGRGFTIFRGWDNTGNCPACAVCCMPSPGVVHVLREFWDDRAGIIDFAEKVKIECNSTYPDAQYVDWGDPAGESLFSRSGGGLTSNAQMMRDAGIDIRPSVKEFEPRREAVDMMLRKHFKGEPALLIDPSCQRLINGFMGGYGYKEIHHGIYSDQPHKNKFSHIHEALQYVIVKLVSLNDAQSRKIPRKKPRRHFHGYGG